MVEGVAAMMETWTGPVGDSTMVTIMVSIVTMMVMEEVGFKGMEVVQEGLGQGGEEEQSRLSIWKENCPTSKIS